MTSSSRKGPALFTLSREVLHPMSARSHEFALTLSLSVAAKSKLTCHPEALPLRRRISTTASCLTTPTCHPKRSEGSAFLPPVPPPPLLLQKLYPAHPHLASRQLFRVRENTNPSESPPITTIGTAFVTRLLRRCLLSIISAVPCYSRPSPHFALLVWIRLSSRTRALRG
jgi:hypothetical protein